MSEIKQIPSPEEFFEKEGAWGWNEPHIKAAKEYAKEVVKYSLEQAAKKGKLNIKDMDGTFFQSATYTYGENDVSIHKESILSLEAEIIKDLKL